MFLDTFEWGLLRDGLREGSKSEVDTKAKKALPFLESSRYVRQYRPRLLGFSS